MVRRFSVILMLLVTLAAAGAPQLKEKPGINPLVGRWQLSTKFHGGKDVTATDPDIVFVFSANGNSSMIRNGEVVPATERYSTDNSVEPASITFKSKYEGEEALDVRAIYKVNRDSLILAVDLVHNNVKLQDFNVNRKDTITHFLSRVKND